MVHCSGCGRPIEKVPDWLSGAKVEFVCNNCPNRQMKNIAFISLEPQEVRTAVVDDDEDELEGEDQADEDLEI
jgi:hypothetical protein